MAPSEQTNTYERGTYYFFDVNTWRKVSKDFHLDYDKLEDRPSLPQNPVPGSGAAGAAQQQQPQGSLASPGTGAADVGRRRSESVGDSGPVESVAGRARHWSRHERRVELPQGANPLEAGAAFSSDPGGAP